MTFGFFGVVVVVNQYVMKYMGFWCGVEYAPMTPQLDFVFVVTL